MRKPPLSLLLALVALSSLVHAAPRKPNIILIVADDLGYGDIGPFGSKKNRTPHLNRLASEGAKLSSFYAAPVCTPSRAQILTGSYAKRVSLPQVLGPAAPIGLAKDEPTLASVLRQEGYATTAIGKWHVGDHPDFLPTAHGFDSYFGLPYSNDMGGGPGNGRRPNRPPLPLVKDATVVQTITPEDQKSLTARYTEAAVSFIREKKDQPFFIYLPHTAVHVPLHPGKDFEGKSANGLYGDWVEELDWSVGKIADTIRELKLDENTLILFSSDNGPWLTKGSEGGEAGPLRGGKGGTYEGGVRVPTVAWWPGHIPAGRTIGAITANFDLLPTFAAVADGKLPEGHKIDGRSLLPLLLGETDESPRNNHFYFAGNNLQAVRSGPWKLAVARQNEANGKPDADGGKPFTPTLYNLDEDIGETRDLAAGKPEIVAKLRELAATVDADLGKEGTGPGVRPPGRVKNPTGLWLPGHQPSAGELSAHYDAKPLADLKPGATLASGAAPQIGNRPFTVSATIEPSKPDGIILAQGGSAAGYALHLVGGKLHFTVRTGSGEATVVSSPAPQAAKYAIEARLAPDGTATLAIDGKPAVSAKAPRLIPRQPAEDFALGHDNAAPVTDYQEADRFSGAISQLKVSID
ncbi:sulfatase-like hydrolase/transferase [Luteolibacter yonseiensis]|uniref:Sulfatase-like hydrolase/transferase n=1 Tax=Luteolibacter yonseiensis TaxID=1144680 RepID=A0A934RA83_9BACT|nr:sulfatase-like hydrolase/transferase [Luteolibacter yonseiensis]MBK1818020.1 sulfatase-like hydrolase/transferase [Luteolibacter yonseiensis]